jgi:ABC-type Mn2+/Zn2+ transport system permease subunit
MNAEILSVGLVVALASSLFGVLVILRRVALVSDALSHVALPGLAIALWLGFSPFFGAFSLLLLAVFFVHTVQKKFEFGTETLVGILFTVGLAVGILLTPNESLLEALFGDISTISRFDSVMAIAGGIAVFAGTLFYWKSFLKTLISPELALGEQINIKKLDLLFLFLLALCVAVGIKTIGALLMGALIMLPAATAKNITRNLRQMALASIVIGVSTILGGLWLSSHLHWPPGPVVVILGSVLFGASLLIPLRR